MKMELKYQDLLSYSQIQEGDFYLAEPIGEDHLPFLEVISSSKDLVSTSGPQFSQGFGIIVGGKEYLKETIFFRPLPNEEDSYLVLLGQNNNLHRFSSISKQGKDLEKVIKSSMEKYYTAKNSQI